MECVYEGIELGQSRLEHGYGALRICGVMKAWTIFVSLGQGQIPSPGP